MANTSSTTTKNDLYSIAATTATISAEELEDFKIADVVNRYVPPVLVIVGNVCNILAVIVMRSNYFRSLSTSVYMTACAVNDGISLIILLSAHWIYVNFPWAIIRSPNSHYMCKFFNFYGYFNCDYTIVLTAAMTTDRAFAILYPFKTSTINLVKRAKITILVLMVVLVAKEFHFLFFSDLVPPERTDRLCDVIITDETYKYFSENIWPWIHFTFLTICFFIIVASNTVIIINVRKSDQMEHLDRAKLSNSNGRTTLQSSVHSISIYRSRGSCSSQSTSRSKWQQITIMLLAESFALILLTYPFSMHLAISSQISDLYTNPEKKATNQLIFSVVFYLLYSNKCVNFCLYCITGSRFRFALKEMCACKKSVSPFTVSSVLKKTALSTSQTTLSSISLNLNGRKTLVNAESDFRNSSLLESCI